MNPSRRPRLFYLSGVTLGPDKRAATVQLAGGSVSWSCGNLPTADAAWRAAGRRVFAWTAADAHVELLLWRVLPQLPEGMRVSDAWMGHWRVLVGESGRLPPLRCRLGDGLERLAGSPDNGENLEAKTWEGDGHRLTIGTEDSEALAMRAGRTLPAAWRSPLQAFSLAPAPAGVEYPVRWDPDGLTVIAPDAPAGACCEFHHAVACQALDHGAEASTWYAVDLMRGALPPDMRT